MTASQYKNSASAQCKAILKAEGMMSGPAGAFNCGDYNNYQCERRIFSPDVETMSHSLKECLNGGDNCVDVEVNQFSTAGALGSKEDAALFLPGGSYNREEISCHHKYFYYNVAVFEGDGASLEEAMAGAMKACDNAGGTP